MTKVEQYIKDFTRRCSNELVPEGFHEWLTPDNALRAAEISKQETIDRFCQLLSMKIGNLLESLGYNDYSINDDAAITDFIDELRKDMGYNGLVSSNGRIKF